MIMDVYIENGTNIFNARTTFRVKRIIESRTHSKGLAMIAEIEVIAKGTSLTQLLDGAEDFVIARLPTPMELANLKTKGVL